MRLREHLITGGGGALLLALVGDFFQGISFFFASLLPDSDHLIDFLWRSRRKLKNHSIKYILEKNYQFDFISCSSVQRDILLVFILHIWEFPLILYLLKMLTSILRLGLLSNILTAAFLGVTVHLILDVVYNIKIGTTPRIRTFSLIEYAVRKKLLRRKGVDPEKNLQKILDSILN